MTTEALVAQDELTITCRNKDKSDEPLNVAATPDTPLREITAHLLDEKFLDPLAGNEVWEIRVERTNQLASENASLASAGVKDGDVLHWTRSVNGALGVLGWWHSHPAGGPRS